jgi:CRISPR system Cascade subunit CasC
MKTKETVMSKTIIDLHVIQTVPPSNINRDDTGSPKTAIYGGVQRARVSSQAWKKAIRDMFREHFPESELGMRTKRIVDMVAREIRKDSPDISENDAMISAEKAITAAGVKTKDLEAQALFFMSATQATCLARLAAEAYKSGTDIDKSAAKSALNRKDHSVEIALFGRMVADDPSLNADASAQVAHSISVHKVDNEYDFFTAVDDVKDRSDAEDAGAGMLGTIEFNSSTLYRYATVFVDLLYDELANDADAAAKAVSEFARGFITSMPTGKQNTFANRTPAHSALITIRDDQPVNFVGAFEKPISLSDESIARRATKKLGEYAADVYASFAKPPVKSYILTLSDVADEFKNQKNRDGSPCEKISLEQLLELLRGEVKSRFGDDRNA